jgi:3-hydroxyisobutyrate dehydrogenase-like beta-hydroxyacid dehydrogenase
LTLAVPAETSGETQVRVGFVGLGNMGEGMAWNLATKGFDVTVRDVRPEVVARLHDAGAASAGTNREIGRRSDVVFVAVFDDKQVLDVCLGGEGDTGVIDGLGDGGVLVVHSTISPGTHRLLAERAEDRGVTVLDAAMTGGGDVAAREGSLTFFVGGDAATMARILPAMEAMAQHVFHVGTLGTGAVAKIISNFLAVANVALVREASRLATAVGLDEQKVLSMIQAGGVGSSWVSNNWARIRTQEENYTTGRSGMVAMASKDMHLAAEVSAEVGTSMPILQFLLDNVIPDLDATGLTG